MTYDRVIAVGDLIDRGTGVLDGLKLLGVPWFFTILGNHEQMQIDAYQADPNARFIFTRCKLITLPRVRLYESHLH